MKMNEYYNFRSGGGVTSGSIGELPVGTTEEALFGSNLHVIHECIVCGNEITIYGGHVCTDGSDHICPECKEAILWAKKKMNEELK